MPRSGSFGYGTGRGTEEKEGAARKDRPPPRTARGLGCRALSSVAYRVTTPSTTVSSQRT